LLVHIAVGSIVTNGCLLLSLLLLTIKAILHLIVIVVGHFLFLLSAIEVFLNLLTERVYILFIRKLRWPCRECTSRWSIIDLFRLVNELDTVIDLFIIICRFICWHPGGSFFLDLIVRIIIIDVNFTHFKFVY